MLVPIGAVGLTAAKARWRRVERASTLLFFVVVGGRNPRQPGESDRCDGEPIGGDSAACSSLRSSIAVWVINVLTFSLLYWQIDRGGPEARVNDAGTRPDWLFPQEGAPAEDVPPGWRPSVRRLPVPRLLDRDGVQHHRCHAADVSRQDADDARKHDLARDDRRRRGTGDQYSRQLGNVMRRECQ